jgi:hypothetical protein
MLGNHSQSYHIEREVGTELLNCGMFAHVDKRVFLERFVGIDADKDSAMLGKRPGEARIGRKNAPTAAGIQPRGAFAHELGDNGFVEDIGNKIL